MFEFLHIERVFQHPDIKNDICIIRNTILETKRFKSDGQIIEVIVFQDLVELFLQLSGVETGSIDNVNVLLLVFVDDVLFDLESFLDCRC